MERHFHEELRELKEKLLKMGLMVEAAIEKAVDSLFSRDQALAKEVIDEEKFINRLEIEIDERGHSLFALGQPMAIDLRLITSILKINTDLERMGDHAVNIAERALIVLKEPPVKLNLNLPEMAKAAQKMLRDVLDAFVNGDVSLARNVLKSDDEVDAFNDNLYRLLEEHMESHDLNIKVGMSLMMIGHNLERIADLSNNIAEDVIYMKQGKDVRHHIDAQN